MIELHYSDENTRRWIQNAMTAPAAQRADLVQNQRVPPGVVEVIKDGKTQRRIKR